MDGGAGWDDGKKLGDVGVPHPHATVAGGGADPVFLVCPVDVDVALFRVPVFFVRPFQPEDAGENEVFFSAFGSDFASGLAGAEDEAQGGIVAEFFADAEVAWRGA